MTILNDIMFLLYILNIIITVVALGSLFMIFYRGWNEYDIPVYILMFILGFVPVINLGVAILLLSFLEKTKQ